MPLQIDDNNILVYLVRHGATVLNQENCFRGPLNPDLAPEGRRDAHLLSQLLKGIDFGAAFVSDKKRAMETANIVLKEHPDVYRHNTPDLHAWDVGWFGGKSKDEYGDMLDQYVQNPDIPVPEGESLNEFKARVQPLFVEALKIADEIGKPVIFVVHSSLIHEVGAMFNDDSKSTLVKPGGAAAIYMTEGKLKAEPIFKANEEAAARRADTVS